MSLDMDLNVNVDEPRNHTVWLLVVATVVDRLVTLQYFGLEANPLVTRLGPSLWLLVTGLALMAIVGVWYHFEVYRLAIGHWLVIFFGLFTMTAVVGNVAVITGLI